MTKAVTRMARASTESRNPATRRRFLGAGDHGHLGGDHPRAARRRDHAHALGAGEGGEILERLRLRRGRVVHRPRAGRRLRLPDRLDVELLVGGAAGRPRR